MLTYSLFSAPSLKKIRENLIQAIQCHFTLEKHYKDLFKDFHSLEHTLQPIGFIDEEVCALLTEVTSTIERNNSVTNEHLKKFKEFLENLKNTYQNNGNLINYQAIWQEAYRQCEEMNSYCETLARINQQLIKKCRELKLRLYSPEPDALSEENTPLPPTINRFKHRG